jgi:MYXO-CTERM domain-containing protein
MTMRTKLVGSTMSLWLLAGCAEDDVEHLREPMRDGALVPRAPIQRIPAPLAGAHCDIDVEGVGVISMEEDYLPHVIQCVNGGANLEALKAQAIAARSVAYYAIETDGGICDSQGCQVYSCNSDPEPIHYQAVNETSGQYLNYNDTLTYGFYVAGDSGISGPGCVGVDANAATEHWITYNSGKSGTDVEQTELGFIHDPADNGYGQNRGCMGQWSARCLENDNGEDVTAILQFFYGDDIGITQAPGACVLPLPGDTTGVVDPTTGAVGDETSAEASSGGDAGMTTMPASTTVGGDASSGGNEGSASAGETTLEPSDGTAEDGAPGALPDTFGEADGDAGGCACTAGESSPTRAGLLGLVFAALRRRRTKKETPEA